MSEENKEGKGEGEMILNPNKADLSRIKPGIRVAMWYLERAFENAGEEFVVTWTNGGKHLAISLHYKNRAIDFLPPKSGGVALLERCREALGKDYDLLDEGDHWHCEHDER